MAMRTARRPSSTGPSEFSPGILLHADHGPHQDVPDQPQHRQQRRLRPNLHQEPDSTSPPPRPCRPVRYKYKYGITREDAVRVVVKNLANAKRNPFASQSGDITVARRPLHPRRGPTAAQARHRTGHRRGGGHDPRLGGAWRGRSPTSRLDSLNRDLLDAHYLGDRDLADNYRPGEGRRTRLRHGRIKNPRARWTWRKWRRVLLPGAPLAGRARVLRDRRGGRRFTASGATAIGGKIP